MSQEVERNVHPKLDQRRLRGGIPYGVILLARCRLAITYLAWPERSTLRWEVDSGVVVVVGGWLGGLGRIAGGDVCGVRVLCVFRTTHLNESL